MECRIKKGALEGIAYFSRPPDTGGMESKDVPSVEAQGLRLVRAFLSLPPDRRAEVLTFVEELVRVHGRTKEGQEASPT